MEKALLITVSIISCARKKLLMRIIKKLNGVRNRSRGRLYAS